MNYNNDNILNELHSEINCVNYVENNTNEAIGYCKFLTNTYGRMFPTNKIFCNITCKRRGPYNNKQLTKEQEIDFIKEGWETMRPRIFGIAEKAYINYNLNADIYIPEIYNDIKNELIFLNNIDGFVKLYLTGSVIIKNIKKPLKDLDIVLQFNTIENYLNFRKLNLLPEKIKNIPIDWFITIGDKNHDIDVYFVYLDPEDKILYTSKWFDLKLNSIEDGIKVVYKTCEYHKKLMNSYLEKSEISKLDFKISWKKVENSWYDAQSFIESVKSRGISSTISNVVGVNNNSGERVDADTYNLRKKSCFGDENNPPCGALNNINKSQPFCGACGCGQNKLTILSSEDPNDYTKLHYPYLECPLKKPGFSNHEK